MSADLLKISAKFRTVTSGHPANEANNKDGSAERQTSAMDSNELNEKSKEQLLAEYSSSSSPAANSSDDEEGDISRVRRKKKSRGNKPDPNLSQINGIDDEDNILVKNEPLLDSQLLNGNTDSTSKNVNVIDELNKWKDYENEGEFYGFDATDTDDCANSSIDIGVKNEPVNDSIATSDTQKKLDDSEATQEYSVSEEIAKANANATSKSSVTENMSKTTDVASAKEVAEVTSIAMSVAEDDKVHESLQNGNDASSENDASDEGGDDDDDDDDNTNIDEDNDREIAR